jgi:hypothetical protein
MRVYSKLKEEYEAGGYTPFVCMIKWLPHEEAAAINRYLQVFATPEGRGMI